MPQLSNIDATRKSQAFRFLGTFWNRTFAQKDKVRFLLDLDHKTSIISNLQAAIHNMAGDTEQAKQVSFVTVSFRFEDVVETGMINYDDPEIDRTYEDPQTTTFLYSNYRIRYYALMLKDIVPTSIQSTNGTLILGIDFFIQAKTWVYFRDDPRLLFPEGAYIVAKGWTKAYRSYLTYFTKTLAPGYDDMIVNWLRRSQTPAAFKLALAAVGRLGIIRKGGRLNSVTQNADGDVIYMFDTETVRVDYDHTALTPGQAYDANTVIGDAIQVYQASDKQTGWWRQIDWRGGIILDPIIPGFRDLTLQDKNTYAYVAGQDAGSIDGSRAHVRLQLTPNYTTELPYWEHVSRQETLQGLYINTALGLPDEVDGGDEHVDDTYTKLITGLDANNVLNRQAGLPDEQPDFGVLPASMVVNALDTFFKILLDRSAFVITLDLSKLEYQTDIFAFLQRERPIGATTIVFGYMSNNPEEAVTWGTSITVSESVHVEALQTAAVEEAVSLSGAVRDHVLLTPILGLAWSS